MLSGNSLPRLATAKQIADFAGLSLARVYELARREGGIPHVRLGHSWRFDPAAVSEWFEHAGTDGG